MISKKTKVWMGVLLIAAVVTLCIGLEKKSKFPDCGLAEAVTWDQLEKINIPILMETTFGYGEQEEDVYKSLIDNEDEIIHSAEQSPIIAIVQPTDKMEHHNGSIGQEFQVKQVLKGKTEIQEEKAMVYLYSPFQIEQEKIIYSSFFGLMNPKETYLIFLKPSSLNGIQSRESYTSAGGILPYIQIGKNLSAIANNEKGCTWNQCRDYEFLSTSKRIIEEVNHIREKILKKYGENAA